MNLQQLSVTAPVDNVLQLSATSFLQGLYPPLGGKQSAETLRNGTSVEAPLDGYQIVPVNTIDVGSGSEDNGWLQEASGCKNARLSSNRYFESQEYEELLSSTGEIYRDVRDVVRPVLGEKDVTFKNAYIGKS